MSRRPNWKSFSVPRQALLALACLIAPTPSPSTEKKAPLFSDDGYRIDAFRAAVPAAVPGAKTIDTEQVRQLLEHARDKPLLIDVLLAPGRPEKLPETSLWLPPGRKNIPGSVWLPNVGFARLSDALDAYYRNNLERITKGRRDYPLVIYCLADCWLSWNAARRAADYGYSRVYWYPEGTDGWTAAKLPLADSEPVPMGTGAPKTP